MNTKIANRLRVFFVRYASNHIEWVAAILTCSTERKQIARNRSLTRLLLTSICLICRCLYRWRGCFD